MKFVPIERLNELLTYEPESGQFFWKVRASTHVYPGGIAGGLMQGYRMIGLGGKSFRAHAIAWAMTYGYWPAQLDHINGDKDDNRIANLRIASHGENMRNRPKTLRNSSGYKGVYPHGKNWRAVIMRDRKSFKLGTFRTKIEAAEAYTKAAKMLHGEFAKE